MSSTKNIIRDQIFTCIEISKRSKVPFLFLSNPGYGKTTSINLYAKTNGYHVETLIGSHYSQDEILGFQANTGNNHLSILEPEWYSRIMHANSKNIPSILFLDELSTVSPNVQGALLQLCFERKIRGGKALPESCIVIAAANYKQNLPGYSDIIAPELNRFCIINLLPANTTSLYSNSLEIINEFTQDFKEVTTDLPVFNNTYTFSEDDNKRFLNDARLQLLSIFQNHRCLNGTSNSPLDFRNTLYDGIYDRMDSIPEVYNFISPRTISYYLRIVRTICEMGLKPGSIVTHRITEGLLGLGTNTFSSDDENASAAEIKFLLNELNDMTQTLVLSYSANASQENKQITVSTAGKKLFNGNSLSSSIRYYITAHDTKNVVLNDELINLTKNIATTFNTTKAEAAVSSYSDNGAFRSDYESVKILYDFLSKKLTSTDKAQLFLQSIQSIISKFEPFYDKTLAA